MYLQPPTYPCQWVDRTSHPVEETSDYDAEMPDRSDAREERGRQYLATRRDNTDRHKVKSLVDYSRRPIRCPRLDCSVNVAFSALTHHFLFDHPEVPILSVEPGAESTLIVSYEALSCNSSRCLALLLVSGKLSLVSRVSSYKCAEYEKKKCD